MKRIAILSFLAFGLLSTQAKAQINVQRASMWCWAACIQSALAQNNVYLTQPQIAARLSGWPQNRPARADELAAVLRSYNFKAWTVGYPANPTELYNTLNSGWKLIAFVNPSNNPQVGHFIMLQGITSNGGIVVSDPANGMTYTQNLNDLYYAWNWSSSVVVGTP